MFSVISSKITTALIAVLLLSGFYACTGEQPTKSSAQPTVANQKTDDVLDEDGFVATAEDLTPDLAVSTPSNDDDPSGGFGRPSSGLGLTDDGSDDKNPFKSTTIKFPTKWTLSSAGNCKEIAVPAEAENITYFEPKISGFKSARELMIAATDTWRASAPAGKTRIADVLPESRQAAITRERRFTKTTRPPNAFYWQIESRGESVIEQIDRFLKTECDSYNAAIEATDTKTSAEFSWSFLPLGICRYEIGNRRFFAGKGSVECSFATYSEQELPAAPR